MSGYHRVLEMGDGKVEEIFAVQRGGITPLKTGRNGWNRDLDHDAIEPWRMNDRDQETAFVIAPRLAAAGWLR
jgi:hypothetical protein